MKTAKLNVYDRSECKKYFGLELDESQICVGPNDGNSCKGDSGGPLTYLLNFADKSFPIQLGIVSFGDRTCHYLSVHTNIYYYKDWISNITKTEKKNHINSKDIDYNIL